MSKLSNAEVSEPKNIHFKVKLSETQYEALYAYSQRTGIAMSTVLREGAMIIVEAAEATLVP